MTYVGKHWWECDCCGVTAELDFGTPSGWQSIPPSLTTEGVRHACSRKCARRMLRADVRELLNRWYPKED